MNRTERKEIETQVREIICQMKEKIEKGINVETYKRFEYNRAIVLINLE